MKFSFSKYKAKSVGGFASKLEKAVYQKLLDREILGLITNIQSQQTVVLQDGKKQVRIQWKIDFSFEENGKKVYCEAKGFKTADFIIKKKLFMAKRIAKLEIWGGNYKSPKLIETFDPEGEADAGGLASSDVKSSKSS